MRIRTIKPEWLLSRSVASLSSDARLLSVGLILMADDEGRGRAGLETIVAEVWRYHAGPDKCAETYRRATGALRELSDAGFVVLYEVDRSEYFLLPGFKRNQVINKKSPSKIPLPSIDSGSTTVVLPEGSQTEQGSGIRDQGTGEGTSTGDAERQVTAEEWTKPKGLLALADVVRSEVVAVFEERKLEPPRETRALTHGAWTDIARFVVGTRARRKLQAEPAAMARDLVRAYYASTDARTVKAGHPISFLAARPEQYIPEGA